MVKPAVGDGSGFGSCEACPCAGLVVGVDCPARGSEVERSAGNQQPTIKVTRKERRRTRANLPALAERRARMLDKPEAGITPLKNPEL